jgi:alkylation response protein AidB-like acyl-CoA dehydrogenase
MTTTSASRTDWTSVARELGPAFAARIEAHDSDDSFVMQNYTELKERKVFSAGVPAELGGGGASMAQLSAMLREFAHHCGSTALALSMHTHQVAIPSWRWRNEQAPVEGLLKRVAAEEIVLVSSGGSDWLNSSGTVEKNDGGYKMTARKVFSSGSPAGTLLMTSAVYDDPADGPTVLHFALPLSAEGVKVLDNWRTMGMRATGSNDIVIDGALIPEQAIGARRPRGKWHHLFHVTAMIALPLVYSVYVGIAEAARDIALKAAARKREDADAQFAVGQMENELRTAQIALDSSIELATRSQPNHETTNEILIRRTLAGKAAIAAVDKAMDVYGGGAFFRSAGLERLFRDVQGARFHPLHENRQLMHTGRHTLGMPTD